MVTRSVDVRELELHAPRLVEEAAQGAQIVITRYGRPRARLTAAAEEERRTGSPLLSAWERERLAFEHMAARLARRYRGCYVAVHGGRVVDSDLDHDALYRRQAARLGREVFFVGRVGGPPPLVEMPGFETE